MRAGNRLFDINYVVGTLSLSPSQAVGGLELDVTLGDDVDIELTVAAVNMDEPAAKPATAGNK